MQQTKDMNDKKKFYTLQIDDGPNVTIKLSGALTCSDSEMDDMKEGDEPKEMVVAVVYLTDEEFEALPEADF